MKTLLLLFFVVFFSVVQAQNRSSDTPAQDSYAYLTIGAPAMYGGISYEHVVYQRNSLQLLPRAGIEMNQFQPSAGHEFNMHT